MLSSKTTDSNDHVLVFRDGVEANYLAALARVIDLIENQVHAHFQRSEIDLINGLLKDREYLMDLKNALED